MDWITLGTEMTYTMCCSGILILVLLALVLLIAQGKSGDRGVRWDDSTETFAKFVERNQDVFNE